MKYAALPAVFLVLLLGIAGTSSAAPNECPGADAPVVDTVAAAGTIQCLADSAREAVGAPRLMAHPKLEVSARAHAEQMVAWRFFGHVDAAGSFFEHLKDSGYADSRFIAGGENLGWLGGGATPRAIVEAWLASAGHRANLLDRRLRDSGVAVVAATPTGVPGATFVHHLGVRHETSAATQSAPARKGKKKGKKSRLPSSGGGRS